MNTTSIASPCQNCLNRHVHCHTDCEKYLQFKAKIAKINKVMRLQSSIEEYRCDKIIGYKIKRQKARRKTYDYE